MDEGRKRTLAIVTAILIAPKLKDYHWDGGTGSPSCESWLAAAVSLGDRVLRMIDTRFASKPADHLNHSQRNKWRKGRGPWCPMGLKDKILPI